MILQNSIRQVRKTKGLTQQQLARTLMPVGDYTKQEIRAMAEKIGLRVADKPDSQEICFVPDNDYAGFISRETGRAEQPGCFVSADGTVLRCWAGTKESPTIPSASAKAWELPWGFRYL